MFAWQVDSHRSVTVGGAARSQALDQQQLSKVKHAPGLIAALAQSGGSTPKASKLYGIEDSAYSGDEQMFDLVHAMRSRIITGPSFDGARILGSILFEMTIEGRDSAEVCRTRPTAPR